MTSWLRAVDVFVTKFPPVNAIRKHGMRYLSLIAVVLYGVAIEFFCGWGKLISAWSAIPLWKIAAALLLMFATYLIRGLRIHYYFLPITRQRLQHCLKIMLLHNLLNNLLPMRTGEASFPLMVRSYFGLSLTRATAGLVLLRLLDLHVLLCISGVTAMVYLNLGKWLWWCLPAVMLLPLLLLPCAPRLHAWQAKLGTGKLQHFLQQLLFALPRNFTQLLCLWLYTWLCWTTKICVFTLVLLWFADTHWLNALGAALGGELSSAIPIHTPGGLGTYEASVMGITHLLGIEGDWILFAAVQLHIMILLSTLLGGVVALAIKAKPIEV